MADKHIFNNCFDLQKLEESVHGEDEDQVVRKSADVPSVSAIVGYGKERRITGD